MSSAQSLMQQIHGCCHLMIHAAHHDRDRQNGQHKLLTVLLTAEGCTQKELAEQLGIRPASLTELIQKAEAKGTIYRLPNARDKRLSDVYLTEEGRALAQGYAQGASTFAGQLFSDFTAEEQAQLSALLQKLSSRLAAMAVTHTAEHLEHHVDDHGRGGGRHRGRRRDPFEH